ncbi:MAG: magnesium/cobalt transporter CorA, partial [Candidatus Pacebacteria bacterium]|nr:magnesium/cobalt transporter CorA [Candidatus Paceibacterota bacterium]
PTYEITFQVREGDVFGLVRERIRNGKGRIRKMGVDYLFYSLLDAVIDGYFELLERVGERVEVVEDKVMKNPVPATLAEIHDLRTQVVFLRKSVWPLREAVSSLEKTESSLIKKNTKVFLRDVYDHTIQLIDTIETYRDVASSLFEMYLSMVSNRMNEVMKVLTIIATIFIPITFVAGIYGMNFEHMPELKYPWAYPAVWGVMIGIVLVMLAYFKRKDWL